MKTNSTLSWLLRTQPVWDAPDEGGAGGGSSETGDDKVSEGAADDAKTTDTVLDGGAADDKSGDGTALGGGADKSGEGTDVKDDDKGGDDKLTDEEKAAADKADEVPEDGKYEFELPEGVELSEEDQAKWSGEFKELGLTRSQAQKLVELQAKNVVDGQKAFDDEVESRQKSDLETAKKDPDIGGDKWDESVKLANKGLEALRGGPRYHATEKNADGSAKEINPPSALEKLILTSGNGNNPEMIRSLRRIGVSYANDKFDSGGSHEAPIATESAWYGETTPDTKKG